MITEQKNYEFLNSINKYLNYWSKKPTVFVLSSSLIVLIVTLVFMGGLLFWTSSFGHAFNGNHSDQSELQIATSGLQTIKRMVGNQQAWSESIQNEYTRLFPNQPIRPLPISYNDNFVSQAASTNQVFVK